MNKRPAWLSELKSQAGLLPFLGELKKRGLTDEMVAYEATNLAFRAGSQVSGVMFWNIHGGLLELSGRSKEWDPHLKRPVAAYMTQSLEKQYQYVWPKPGQDPRIIFEYGSNILRRLRSYPALLKTLFPKLKSYVVIHWRMTSSALVADYVLPAAGRYEKAELKWGTTLMPYIHAGSKVGATFGRESNCRNCSTSIPTRTRLRSGSGLRDGKCMRSGWPVSERDYGRSNDDSS